MVAQDLASDGPNRGAAAAAVDLEKALAHTSMTTVVVELVADGDASAWGRVARAGGGMRKAPASDRRRDRGFSSFPLPAEGRGKEEEEGGSMGERREEE